MTPLSNDTTCSAIQTSQMRIALYQPDIPQNTGTILRAAACLGVNVDIIGPTGFDISDRALKRAALDYLPHVQINRHLNFDEFDKSQSPSSRLILLTTQAKTSYTSFKFKPCDILLLGSESKGVPQEIHDKASHRICIPMKTGLRSLNIAIATAMVLGEALRQLNNFPSTSSPHD